MHHLSEHLLVIHRAGVVRPLANGGVEVINQECGGLTLLSPFASLRVGGQHYLAGLTRSIALQVGSVDGHNMDLPLAEVNPRLKTLAIARGAEDPENERPVVYSRQVHHEVLIDREAKAFWDVYSFGRRPIPR
jgi:hypothetical protein